MVNENSGLIEHSGIPVEVVEGREGRQDAADKLAQENLPPSDVQEQGYRTFVAAKEFENSKFLAVAGVPVKMPPHPGMSPGITPYSQRDGDKFVKFSGGVLVTNDYDIIEWCENHKKVCRDAQDPRTQGWVTMKEMQTDVASRDAVLPTDVDVDAMAFPEDSNIPPTQELERGVDNTSGKLLVDAAQISQKTIEEKEKERAADPSHLQA